MSHTPVTSEPPVTSADCETIDDFRARLRQAASEPFDLTTPPLLRCLHATIGQGGTALGFVCHHVICDSWSLELFMRDLTLALMHGTQFDGMPPSHRQWALDEQRWFGTAEADLDRAYWRAQIDGRTSPLDIGHGDRRQPRRGEVRHFDIPTATVDVLVRELAATRQAILLAAFAGLLRRYSLNESVNVGLPIAGRNSPEAERTIGYLSNTIVMVEEFTAHTTFRTAVASALRHLTEGLEHGRLPFQEIVRVAQARRDGGPPLYQVMFGPQNTPVETKLHVDGHPLHPIRVHNGSAKCDLTMLTEAGDDRIRCEVEYDLDLFDGPWAERFCRSYRHLLAAAAEAPDTPVDELPLLSPSAMRAAFAKRADATRYDHERPAHRAVESQAAATPDAVAVTWPGGSLTYRQLDQRANALARRLIELRSGPRSRVGILLSRGPDLISAILGTLKAGAAFVPLDRRFPAARIAAICADARVSTVITDLDGAQDLTGDLAAGPADRCTVLVPDSQTDETPPAVRVRGSDLAYIYYTSGSTGTPKGVPIDHRCAMTRLAFMRDEYPLAAGEAALHKTSLIFDIALWEIFLPLFAGGTVVVLEPGRDTDVAEISCLLRTEPIVLAHFVPSALNAYLESAVSGGYPRLRWVVASGEAVTASLLRRAANHFAVAVHGQYGQTETAEVTTWHEPGDQRPGSAMLGHQNGAYSLYIVDPALHPVPPGVPGELCVSGLGGLAWGYLNKPALTAERFLPHPNPSEPGQRLYRTGDLARVLDSGLIEYLGRTDQQLKVHGCRIEPGEIESACCAHPAVTSAAVVVRPSVDTDPQLVAYLLCSGKPPSAQALAEQLREALPWFMLPSAFVVLPEFPRTMSGKIDRDQLPPPGREAYLVQAVATESPADGLEAAVAAEWSRVLGISELGRTDDFFLLGGTSLSAVRVLAALSKRFGVRLGIADFTERPTVAAVAENIENGVHDLVSSMPESDVDRLLQSLQDDEPPF